MCDKQSQNGGISKMKESNIISEVHISDQEYDKVIVAEVGISSDEAKKYIEIMAHLDNFEKKFSVKVLHIEVSGYVNFYNSSTEEISGNVFKEIDNTEYVNQQNQLREGIRTHIDRVKIWNDQILFAAYIKNTNIEIETTAFSIKHLKSICNESNEDEEVDQCIVCGTLIDDLDEEEIVETELGKFCYGCYHDGSFKKCNICGKHHLVDEMLYDEKKDQYTCHSCHLSKGKENDGKYYCPVCKKYTDRINEILDEGKYIEHRLWQNGSYDLVDTSLETDMLGFSMYCPTCNTRLDNLPNQKELRKAE